MWVHLHLLYVHCSLCKTSYRVRTILLTPSMFILQLCIQQDNGGKGFFRLFNRESDVLMSVHDFKCAGIFEYLFKAGVFLY